MKIAMIEKVKLSPAQLSIIENRISDSSHINDKSFLQDWENNFNGKFAFFTVEAQELVALVEASGINNVQPAWWIDTAFRGKGYGKYVIELLANNLKKRGVTCIGPMLIQTHQQMYDAQSTKLAQRLRKYFSENCS